MWHGGIWGCRQNAGALPMPLLALSEARGFLIEYRNHCGAENFRWLSGQEHISSWVKDAGFRSDFCSKCGSPVPNPLRSTPYYWVPVGLLDDEQKLEIAAHVFVGSKVSWEVIGTLGGLRRKQHA